MACSLPSIDLPLVLALSQILCRVPRVLVVAAVSAGLLSYAFLPSSALSWFSLAWGLLLIVGVVLSSRAAHRLLGASPFVENVMVLGKTELARSLVAEMARHPRYHVLNVTGAEKPTRVLHDETRVVFSQALEARGSLRPHRIVVALSERRGRVPTEALLDAKRQGIAIETGLQLYERLTGRLALDWLQPSDLIFSSRFCPSSFQCLLQRMLSIVLAAVGLLVCAPLLVLLAVLVKLDSHGPVFFVQERIGLNGRRFPLMKFRTMHPADERPSEWVGDNGNRITRVGRWLRKFRLDELPQLYNVLLGHMNLVGPRPHPASNYELFMTHIPFYSFRSLVRPGITGWAQVRYGYANNLEEETEKMRYDLYYIKHLSLMLDIEILLRTVKVVVLGQDRVSVDETPTRADQEVFKRLDAA